MAKLSELTVGSPIPGASVVYFVEGGVDKQGVVSDLPSGGGAGDMVLASVQTVTGAKQFGTIGGAVGKLILAGSTSGSTILNSAAIAGSLTLTLPAAPGANASPILVSTAGVMSYPTGTPTGSKFLRDDGSWQSIAGGGDALVANPLSQFAATTSLQLKGVISDETGSGALVFANTPTLVTPALGAASATTLTASSTISAPLFFVNDDTVRAQSEVLGLSSTSKISFSSGATSGGSFDAEIGRSGVGELRITNSALLGTASSATGILKLAVSGSANVTTIQGGDTPASAVAYKWPADNPGAAEFLKVTSFGGGIAVLEWAAGGGGGDALVANPLSQFASTTSAQLAGVISNETGSSAGLLVFNDSPTIVTPTIASFANATHTHADVAGGGTISAASLTGTLADARLSANVPLLNAANSFSIGQTIIANSATDVPLILQGAASQSANLFTVNDSTPTTLFAINSLGRLRSGSNPSFAATYISVVQPSVTLATGSGQHGMQINVGNVSGKATTGLSLIVSNPSSGSTTDVTGISGFATNDHTSTVNNLIGMHYQAYQTAGGTATLAIGANFSVSNFTGTGATITTAIGGRFVVGNVTGNTITEGRGISLSSWTNAGTFTTSYGIYADTSIDVGATRWFIHSLSTSPSLLTGDLTVSALLKLGSGPTTINNAAGKVLVAAIDGWPANASGVLTNDGAGVLSWGAAGAGDMVLASVQTVTGAKQFGTIGGAVGKLILAGATSGSTILNSAAVAGSLTLTLPAAPAASNSPILVSTAGVMSYPTGTPDGTKFLRDDGSWAAGGGGSQTPWTADVDADSFSLLFDDATGIKSSETGNPELLLFTSVASAVNRLTITNAATGNPPVLSATGGDTNISISLVPKGTGAVLASTKYSITGAGWNITDVAGPAFQSAASGESYFRLLIGTGEARFKAGVNFVNGSLDAVGPDTGLARNAAGLVEFNDGSAGTFRDLVARTAKLGATTARGTTEGTNQVVIFNGTAPAGTLTNGASFFCDTGEMKVMDAGGTATLLSPHDDEGNWVFDSTDTVTGRRLKVDVEKLLRFVNDHFGLDFVHEFEVAH